MSFLTVNGQQAVCGWATDQGTTLTQVSLKATNWHTCVCCTCALTCPDHGLYMTRHTTSLPSVPCTKPLSKDCISHTWPQTSAPSKHPAYLGLMCASLTPALLQRWGVYPCRLICTEASYACKFRCTTREELEIGEFRTKPVSGNQPQRPPDLPTAAGSISFTKKSLSFSD